jgi:ribosomal protein S18 acetylase RimI-like enzyme
MVPERPIRGKAGGEMIRLEPMDEATFEAWRMASIRDYAAEKVEAGAWLAENALERATREFAELLPGGRMTAGHVIRSVVNDSDERVGVVWFAEEDRPFGRVEFIYDIAIEPAHRRQGYAQATLEAVEAHAREHGCVGVQLHVFGGNTGARELYRRSGYVETDVTMLKRVDE